MRSFKLGLVIAIFAFGCGSQSPTTAQPTAQPTTSVVSRPPVESAKQDSPPATTTSVLEDQLAKLPVSSRERRDVLAQLIDAWEQIADSETDPAEKEHALRQAVRYGEEFKRTFSNDPKLDDVLLSIAEDSSSLGDTERVRRTYMELFQKFPNSCHIPKAYYAFGELFFAASAKDPAQLELAKRAYEEVLKYPPPENLLYGYAHYKLAFVSTNLKDSSAALVHMKLAIEWTAKFTLLPNATVLERSARHDIIPMFAASGAPHDAFDFFRPISGDTGANLAATSGMVLALAQEYLNNERYPDLLQVDRIILFRAPNPSTCEAVRNHYATLKRTPNLAGLSLLQSDIVRFCRT